MKTEAADGPALPPGLWERVRGRRCWKRCVVGGVEAGHRRRIGKPRTEDADRGQRPGLVKWRQARQVAQGIQHGAVEPHRFDEGHAAVHDPVPDGIHALEIAGERCYRLVVTLARPRVDVATGDHAVGIVQQTKLQRAGASVDHQDLHHPFQAQLVISGSSSPWSRV
jgi:hypothetical protein